MAGLTATTSTSSLPPVESTGALQGPPNDFSQSPSQALQPPPPPAYTQYVQSRTLTSGDLSIPWRAPPGETDSPSYHWPEAPSSDVEDNEKVREPVYKMTQALTTIAGYEGTTTKESSPGERPKMQRPSNKQRQYRSASANIASEADAKNALIDMASHHCCYGNLAAKDMNVQNVESLDAVHYTLKTFVESRTSKRAYIPYKGQNVDSPLEGAPLVLWDVVNPADETWKPGVKTVKVAHSSTIETCFACTGRGFNKCFRCKGRGRTKCKYCKATGKKKREDCLYCKGKGRQRCFRCNGYAVISCCVCEAYKQLEFYIEIKSKFDVKRDEYLHHKQKLLPRKLLRGVGGSTLFEEDLNSSVAPLSNYPEVEVNNQSEKFVSKHAKVKSERIILQKHQLVGIPIALVHYKWRGKESSYWMYGQGRKVYAPDYPQQCCCKYKCILI